MKTALSLVAGVLLGATVAAQQPQIQNGRVETRRAAALDRELATLAAGATEPVWAAWRVPIVDGERGGCSSWYWDDGMYLRGMTLDYAPIGATVMTGRPQITKPTGPVPLEAGTGLIVLVRLIEGRPERLRSIGDDCPIDAGGRTVYWLEGVTPADSVRVLEGYTRDAGFERLSTNARRNFMTAALEAIAYHRDAAADPIIDRLATAGPDSDLRQRALTLLGSRRGARGFATLRKLLEAERVPSTRVQLVNALGQTREPATVETLRALTNDSDAKVRAAAVYYFAIRGGQAVVADVTSVIDNDVDDAVRARAVSGLARLPNDVAVPLLIQLARTNKNAAVKKQAVSSLTRSNDARAKAFLEELLK